jgi:hypothetical protein
MRMKAILSLVVAFLAPLLAQADDLRDKLLGSSLMTGARCSQSSPDVVCESLAKSGQFGPIGLAQEDTIHTVYAERLAPVVESAYAKASKLRPHMVAALRTFNQFIAGVHHGGRIGHWDERIPAHIEWVMLGGSTSNFGIDGSGYTLTDIRNTATALFRAQFSAEGPEDLPSGKKYNEIMRLLDEALEHWQKAEDLMTPEEKKYYRDVFMKVVAKYL